jgi:SpoVK/Ycf46/Vps4 family AAA+-type ATPase
MVTGPAGSGKTKVAAVIAHIFQTLGILATDNVVMTTRQNFIGQYVGQSAPKTQKLLSASLEGVVFIDEAYTLTPCPDDHVSGNGANEAFAREAVGELINFMDKFSGCFVIIAAGYKDKMYNCFLTFNEGMARRFPKVVDFIPYQNEDMNEIFLHFVDDSIDISLFSKAQLAFFQEMIFALNEQEVFNNQAGDMLNLAKMVAEDAMLAGDDYDKPRMILTLKKFCAMKNVAISM